MKKDNIHFKYKRKLIEDLLSKAEQDYPQSSISGQLKRVELDILDHAKIQISYKSLDTYRKKLLIDHVDYNIKPDILNGISRYLGYTDYTNFCTHSRQETVINIESTEADESFHHMENGQKITINVQSKPNIILSHLMAKSNQMGIVGLLCILGFLGNQFLMKEPNSNSILGFASPSSCMVWKDDRYESVNCNANIEKSIPFEAKRHDNFQRVTRMDTITLASVNKLYYCKKDKELEIFTTEGKHPENGKQLRPLSSYMIKKYILNKKNFTM